MLSGRVHNKIVGLERMAVERNSMIPSKTKHIGMKFSMIHNNINVFDLERSLVFYGEALGLSEVKRIALETGEFIIVYLGDASTGHKLELPWLRDRKRPYDQGDNEFHLAFGTDDYDAALAQHTKMGCVALVNEEMGIYFVTDPDSYWLEVLPPGRG